MGASFLSTLSNPQRSGIYWVQPSWAVPATRSPPGRPDVVTLLPFEGWGGGSDMVGSKPPPQKSPCIPCTSLDQLLPMHFYGVSSLHK